MPAYSFKEQFCPYVIDGSKPHTIRAYRNYPVKVGDKLSLYYGMRTKHCIRLRVETCTEVKTIVITARGTVVVIEKPQLTHDEAAGCIMAIVTLEDLSIVVGGDTFDTNNYVGKPSTVLTDADKDRLAWKDGFRPPGTSLDAPTGAFKLMLDFWRESHDLPFVGNIIYWEPNNQTI